MSATGRIGHLVVFSKNLSGFKSMERDQLRHVVSSRCPDGIFAYHEGSPGLPEHFHWLHPCKSKSEWDKCGYRKHFKISPSIRIKGESRGVGFGERYLRASLTYFQTGCRRLEQIKYAGTDQLATVKTCRSDIEEEDPGEEKDIQKFFFSCKDKFTEYGVAGINGETSGTDAGSGETSSTEISRGHKRKWPFGNQIQAFKEIQEIIRRERLISGDLEHNTEAIEILLKYNILFNPQQKKEICLEAEKAVYTPFNKLLFHEKIIEMSKNPFSITQKNHYYSLYYSFWVMVCLLREQFRDWENTRSFIDTIIDWANFNIPKKNCLYLIGPQNCGKTFFADTIKGIMWNVGNMSNLNKNQGNFFADKCVNRSLIVFEEGNLSPDANFVSDFKKLAAGEPCTINRKHKDGVDVSNTPILLTTNHEIARHADEDYAIIETRLLRYRFRQQEWLKNLKGYPHPLVWQKLINLTQEDYLQCPEPEEYNDAKEPMLFHGPGNQTETKWFKEKKQTLIPDNFIDVINELNNKNDII